jgi:signal transduction histidine kinase
VNEGRAGAPGVNATVSWRFSYRLFLCLAVALVVAGSSTSSLPALLRTAGVYLALCLAGLVLHGLAARGWRRSLWRAAAAMDVAAQAWVVLRASGSQGPVLLLLAVPILIWGVLQGAAGGVWAAVLGIIADFLLGALTGESGEGRVPAALLHVPALLVLGLLAGLLGRRIRREEKEHQETRRELEQAQLDAESIVSRLARGLLCLDSEGRISRVNHRAEALLAPYGPIVPGTIMTGCREEDPLRPLALHLAQRLGSTREETHEVVLGSPAAAEAPNGCPSLPLEVATAPVLGRTGEAHGLVVLLSDVTERRAHEAVMRRRERLAVIGELAAGLAHEIRNSLKPITGSVELLRRVTATGDDTRDALMEIILRESESLENFLTEFLHFARDKKLEMELLPLERVLGEELTSLNALPGPFRLIRPEQDERVLVRADRSALRQAVRNLGINALEATGRDGAAGIEVGWRREGEEAVIFIRDHGPGIPQEVRSRIFEPFFTTKPHGTGLGLAIARDLVDRLGGCLSLSPAEGGGTRASIRLPVVREESEGDRARAA